MQNPVRKSPDITGQQFNDWYVVRKVSSESGLSMYECRCKCGYIRNISYTVLTKEKSKRCRSCANLLNRKDISGKIYGEYKVIKFAYTRKKTGYWICECSCGNTRYVPINKIKLLGKCEECYHKEIYSNLKNKMFGTWLVLEDMGKQPNKPRKWKCECQCFHKTIKIISCLSLINEQSSHCMRCSTTKTYKGISGFLFSRLKYKARHRFIDFDLTKEYLWNLYEEQNKKCPFTGDNLYFPTNSGKYDGNISLDRKDSSKGYIEGNVQWTTKTINVMKNNSSDEEFIRLCTKIASYNK